MANQSRWLLKLLLTKKNFVLLLVRVLLMSGLDEETSGFDDFDQKILLGALQDLSREEEKKKNRKSSLTLSPLSDASAMMEKGGPSQQQDQTISDPSLVHPLARTNGEMPRSNAKRSLPRQVRSHMIVAPQNSPSLTTAFLIPPRPFAGRRMSHGDSMAS